MREQRREGNDADTSRESDSAVAALSEASNEKEESAMSLLRQGKAQALTIYLGESDQWQGQPLYVTIIHVLREHECAGATATRAVLGYGAGARLHEQRSWQWSSDASIVIQVIDQPDRLRRLLPQLQGMLSSGLMTLQEIEVLKYTHAHTRGLPTKLPVRQVMETSMTTVQPETPIATVLDLLLAAPFRALPVIDDHKRLLGIISTGDLMKAEVLPVMPVVDAQNQLKGVVGRGDLLHVFLEN
jgi:PII-like signaling protein